MSGNKSAKEELIRRYGAECFIDKLHLRKDDAPKRYKSRGQRKRMKQLTFHHICMRKDGGEASPENGALLSVENHAWFHQQSPAAQGYMNAIFQEYKRQTDELRVVFVDELEMPFTVKATTFSIKERERYNRAKEKEETQKLIDDYYDEER